MEEKKEKYSGPFIIVYKPGEYTMLEVWHPILHDPIQNYFNTNDFKVQDLKGNELKLEDIEINKCDLQKSIYRYLTTKPDEPESPRSDI